MPDVVGAFRLSVKYTNRFVKGIPRIPWLKNTETFFASTAHTLRMALSMYFFSKLVSEEYPDAISELRSLVGTGK